MKFNLNLFTFFLSTIPIFCSAQVGIGTSTPNASAKLEVSSSNKGFLPPRITLTGTSDVSTIASPATGLMVYNTATAGTSPSNVTPGFYFYDGSKWQRIINQQPDATIDFSVNADPNTAGTTFTGTAASKDYIYVSTIDNTQWTYNGSAYVTYTPAASTPWYLSSGTKDAGANKTSTIYRTGSVGIGNTAPTSTLEIGSTTGAVPGVVTINPQNSTNEGGQITIKKSITGSTQDWFIDQFTRNSGSPYPMLRIFPGTDGGLGLSIQESGKVIISPSDSLLSIQTEKLLVNGGKWEENRERG